MCHHSDKRGQKQDTQFALQHAPTTFSECLQQPIISAKDESLIKIMTKMLASVFGLIYISVYDRERESKIKRKLS